MNTRYKLTNQDLTTYNSFQWKLNEWKETSGEGELCTEGWLHCYSNPLLAIILNHIHANIEKPKLFEVEVEGKCKTNFGLKEGWTRMRLVKELALPEISLIQKVAFGILCTLEVYKEEKFILWANNWLNGKDRSKESAAAATYATYAAYYSANAESAYAARYAAAAAASNAAADDYYAYRAAYYAAVASYANINLIKIAERCLEYK